MKKSLILIVFILTYLKVDAQIYFQNNTDEPVFVTLCMEYKSSSSKYWGSEGWYKVDPGDKIMVSSAIGWNDNIYYYAKSTISNKEYTGETRLLVNPTDKFFIKNANKDYQKTQNPSYEWKNFRHIDMNAGTLQLKYTIVLNY